MSRRLLRLEIPVMPDRKMFRVLDATADPDAPGSPVPIEGALVSSSREQLLVTSLQENVGVRVTIEEWDSAPPAFSDGYEDEAKCVLYLRGQLSVDMGPAGRAVQGLMLAGGVGDYGVRVYARNRAEVVRQYASCSSETSTRWVTISSGPAVSSTAWSSTCSSSGARPSAASRVRCQPGAALAGYRGLLPDG